MKTRREGHKHHPWSPIPQKTNKQKYKPKTTITTTKERNWNNNPNLTGTKYLTLMIFKKMWLYGHICVLLIYVNDETLFDRDMLLILEKIMEQLLIWNCAIFFNPDYQIWNRIEFWS